MFAQIANAISKHIIAQFHGAIADIPAGWHLCDGTNGTLDLQEKFIVCVGGFYDVGSVGGSTSHKHSITADLNDEEIDSGTDIASGSGYDKDLDSVAVHTFMGLADTRPPYYAIAFIEKL